MSVPVQIRSFPLVATMVPGVVRVLWWIVPVVGFVWGCGGSSSETPPPLEPHTVVTTRSVSSAAKTSGAATTEKVNPTLATPAQAESKRIRRTWGTRAPFVDGSDLPVLLPLQGSLRGATSFERNRRAGAGGAGVGGTGAGGAGAGGVGGSNSSRAGSTAR